MTYSSSANLVFDFGCFRVFGEGAGTAFALIFFVLIVLLSADASYRRIYMLIRIGAWTVSHERESSACV